MLRKRSGNGDFTHRLGSEKKAFGSAAEPGYASTDSFRKQIVNAITLA